jgi:hypothetical protein
MIHLQGGNAPRFLERAAEVRRFLARSLPRLATDTVVPVHDDTQVICTSHGVLWARGDERYVPEFVHYKAMLVPDGK